jgi:FdhD protein
MESTLSNFGHQSQDQGTACAAVPIVRVDSGGVLRSQDTLAVEEPLEIRLGFGPLASRSRMTVAVTMRTPGCDEELAAGFLFTEAIIESREEVVEIRSLRGEGGPSNVVRVELRPEVEPDVKRLDRHFYTTSSCGVCGTTSLEALETVSGLPPITSALKVAAEVLIQLPDRLRAAQDVFGRTGGLHASALFTTEGELVCSREDVGRHNALDKLIGAQLLEGRLPVAEQVILLSGRASFELLQKAFMAGAPVVAAVGAPSSLAVELAERFGITLVGWLRGERFSIYTHAERIRLAS